MAYTINPTTGMPDCFAGEHGGYCCYDCYGCSYNYEAALCDAENERATAKANKENNN